MFSIGSVGNAVAGRAGVAALLLLMLAADPLLAGEPAPVDIRITTHLGDRQSFSEGDRISFLLSLDRDAYVYLFYRDAAGNRLQLLPNRRMPRHFYSAGVFMPVPSAGQRFQFSVNPPFGVETVYAFASDTGEFEFDGKLLDSGLILLDAEIDRLDAEIRRASRQLFGRAELTLTTQAAAESAR